MNDSAVDTSYDEIPYEGSAFSYTHPAALAMTAALRGLETPTVESCRVLEIGCAGGANLVPVAATLPQSECVGIDLSSRQIADARALADESGVRNVRLVAMSVTDLDESFGQFDYIVCHGVFSWVPPFVQDKILEVCARRLTPRGVAYVSYNTYPGWRLRSVVRDLMAFHGRSFENPRQRLAQARGMLKCVAGLWAQRSPDSVYGRLLREEHEDLSAAADSYVFHEHLEDCNTPLYFEEMVRRTSAVGLQYLWEAGPSALARSLPAEELGLLEQLSDDLTCREQYFDFLRNRSFRRTLFCHADVELAGSPQASAVIDSRVVSLAEPQEAAQDASGDSPRVQFRSPSGRCLTTNRPIIRSLLERLFAAWPEAISFAELLRQVEEQQRAASDEERAGEPVRDADSLAALLLDWYLDEMVELTRWRPPMTCAASERPAAAGFSRALARRGARTVNLRHHGVQLEPFERWLLCQLDGRRSREELLHQVEQLARSGDLGLHDPDGAPLPPDVAARHAREMAADKLARFARLALLSS